MRPEGLAEVEAARSEGRWAAAYLGQAEATVPGDLAAALVAHPRADQSFAALNRIQQYAVILELSTARTPERRATPLHRAVERLDADPP